jgi:hypothetical protein
MSSKAAAVDPHTKTGGELKEYKNKAEGVHEINSSCLDVSFVLFCQHVINNPLAGVRSFEAKKTASVHYF